jgi:hypothetical protein
VKRMVAAPPEKVFAMATDFGGAAQTISAITRMEMLTEGPARVGTRFRETRKMFGKEATEEMTVTELEAPHRYVLGAESHGSRYRTELRFEPLGAGTEMTMHFSATPLTLGAKIMAFLMKPMMKKLAATCGKDLEDLRDQIEKGPLSTALEPIGAIAEH